MSDVRIDASSVRSASATCSAASTACVAPHVIRRRSLSTSTGGWAKYRRGCDVRSWIGFASFAYPRGAGWGGCATRRSAP